MSRQSITQQRVALARDVLKQLQSRRFTAIQGVYVDGPLRWAAQQKLGRDGYDFESWTPKNGKLDVRDLIQGEFAEKSCEVCAKGALFMAHILRNDKVTLAEFCSPKLYVTTERVKNGGENPIPAFTPKQLDEIEVLFEGEIFIASGGVFTSDQRIALKNAMRRLPRSPKARLAAIMRKIIRNKGRKIVL